MGSMPEAFVRVRPTSVQSEDEARERWKQSRTFPGGFGYGEAEVTVPAA